MKNRKYLAYLFEKSHKHLAELEASAGLYGVQEFLSEHALALVLGQLQQVHAGGGRRQAVGRARRLDAERRLQVLLGYCYIIMYIKIIHTSYFDLIDDIILSNKKHTRRFYLTEDV